MFRFYDVNIKKYGDEYKVTFMRRCVNEEGYNFTKDDTNSVVGDRFLSSLSRSRSTVLELALCNEWEYFCTFTLNKEKYDRNNLDLFRKDLNQYIRDLRKKGINISYILVPQRHKNGAWHLHGLLNGIPSDRLFKFVLGKHPIDLVYSPYLNWIDYEKRFGYNTVDIVKNKSAVSRYILRYITRDWDSSQDNYKNLYFCSQGLKRAVDTYSGCSSQIFLDVDFENEFMASKWVSEDEINNIISQCF